MSSLLGVDLLALFGLPVSIRVIHTGFAMATVGGDRYGWFANQEIHDLAIDNAELRTSTNAIKQDIRNDLAAYRATITDNEDGKRLDEAIKALVHRNYAPALETLRKVGAESGVPMVRWGAHWAADKMSGQTTAYTPPDDPWKADPSIRDLTE